MISMKEIFEEYSEMAKKISHLELENWLLRNELDKAKEELEKCHTSDLEQKEAF